MHQTTVLLVEDIKVLRQWIAMHLESHGFQVLAPETVEQALALAHVYPFHALITDWRLANGHDGFAVLAAIRSELPDVPAILISADPEVELAGRARQAGFNMVLEKPFPPWKILDALKSVVPMEELETA